MRSCLFELYINCGAAGAVTGLFVADPEKVDAVIGRQANLAKFLHISESEFFKTLEAQHFDFRTSDLKFIMQLVEVFDGETISGYNPVEDLLPEEEWED